MLRCSTGSTGFVDCAIHAVYEAGDHYVVIGRVQDLGFGDGSSDGSDGPDGTDGPAAHPDPLLFYRGRYTATARD